MAETQKIVLLIENSRESGREFMRGVAKYARHHRPWTFHFETPFHYKAATYKLHRWAGIRKRTMSELKAWGATGIIARDCVDMDEIISLDLPTILFRAIDTELRKGFPYVITDSEAIGRLAAEHFLDRGFRNFAYFGFNNIPSSNERGKTFSKKIDQAGFQVHLYEESQSRSQRSLEKEQMAIGNWLRGLVKPVGLMVCNDHCARDLIEISMNMGIRVPEEVAILGVDNDELECELMDPSLSSVALNCERAGYEAAELLDKMMHGTEVEEKVVLVQAKYVVPRRSTEIEAVQNKDVADALRYIRDHAHTPIQVQDVAYSVALSVRALEKKFRLELDRTIFDQIQNTRMEEARRMLIETNLQISEIALSLGYSGAEKLSRSFRKEMGMTPLKFRRRYGV